MGGEQAFRARNFSLIAIALQTGATIRVRFNRLSGCDAAL